MRGSTWRVLLRHILPNVLPNVLVLATFALGTAIVMESGLSFVGLGVPTDTPTWGRMLSEGRDYMDTAWWLTVFPGSCIFCSCCRSTCSANNCAIRRTEAEPALNTPFALIR